MFYKYLGPFVSDFTSGLHAHIQAVGTLLSPSPDLVPATNESPKAVADEPVATDDPKIQTD